MTHAVKTGPRGTRLVVESHGGVPMVWLQVAIPGGAAGDPEGAEGFAHHLAKLCRRGAGTRDRLALDTTLDELGASVEVWAQRDAIALSAMCLARNLDEVVDIVADILATPHLREDEHQKLLRETRMALDEVRDDDAQVATRFFHRHCVPGHPYARTLTGTESSLDALAPALEEMRATRAAQVVPAGSIVGFAGAIDERAAADTCARLVRDLPDRPAAPLPPVASPEPPRGRRLVVVDKPERSQSQIVIGHLAPPYGHPDTPALLLIETIFGGMFTSRLMQEIRVKRGWSYGADCHIYHSRGPHWLSIHLAPPAEVTADALALTLAMFDDLAARGVTAEELSFAKRYLAGNLPFRRATARARLKLCITSLICGLGGDYADVLSERVQAVTLDQVNEAARRWLHPEDALSVVVATADSMLPSVDRLGISNRAVVPYDSY